MLDLIILATDLENLDYDPKAQPATGFILEAHSDPKKGILVSGIVTNGTIETGDNFRAGQVEGKIRGLFDFLGKKIDSAQPSSPVLIWGLGSMPIVGEVFETGQWELSKATARSTIQLKRSAVAEGGPDDVQALKLIIRADNSGSLEALEQVIVGIPTTKKISIISKEVGSISDSDLKLAKDLDALVIGFKSSPTKPAKEFLIHNEIEVVTSEIIYDLVKKIEETLKEKIVKILGKLEVMGSFKSKGTQHAIGGKVAEGSLKNGLTLDLERNNNKIGTVRILNLQKDKKDVPILSAGEVGGLLVDGKKPEIGDVLTWQE